MSIASDLIIAQRREFDRALGRLTARERAIVDGAMRDIERDLARARPGTWTEAKAKATMAMLKDAVRQMVGAQYVLVRNRLGGFARLAQMQVAGYLTALDREFGGIVAPLEWDSIQWLRGYARPMMKTRLRIYEKSFKRYGAASVDAIENAIARKMLVGKSWTEARPEVMDAVREAVGGQQWKVDRILRTEISVAHNSVTMAALFEEDEPDDPMLKKLVATFDAVTAQDSRDLHGQTVPVRELFTDVVSGREFDHPPNRPNDREIVVGWRKSWGDDSGFDRDTSVYQDTASGG